MRRRDRIRLLRGSFALLPLLATACAVDSSEQASPSDHETATAVFARVSTRGRQQLSGHLSPEIQSAPLLQRVPGSTSMHVAISLPVRNEMAAKERVRRVSDPADPSYRAYLTPAEYAAAYGASPSEYQSLIDWATSHGLAVERSFSNRLVLSLVVPSERVEDALHVEMHYRARADGSRFYAPDREPSLDLDLPVLHVDGLTDFVRPKPACADSIPVTSGPPLCLDGTGADDGYSTDLRNAYLGATSCASLTGAGQTVALVEYNGFTSQDIAAFAAASGLKTPTIRTPLQNVAPTPSTLGDPGHGEVALDIEMVWSMAPGAAIDVYEGASQTDALAAIATASPLPQQISSSWFDGNNLYVQALLDELALQGQSYFQASGDNGGYTSSSDIRSAGGVTVVGGTILGVNRGASASGYYQEEAGWSGSYGSGGGYLGPNGSTAAVPIPFYQQGIAVHGGGFSTQYRNLPDVALTAEMLSIWYSTTATGPAQNWAAEGTSAAAPLWAAVMALVNQQNPSKPVGFANPELYALGKANAGYFHDITADQTPAGMFSSAPGYDLTTGWGTPTCSLITALGGDSFEHAPTAVAPSGFKTWGGQLNQCMVPAGDDVAAGVAVVSQTCTGSTAENWVLAYGHGAISPATNTNLCLDISGNPTSGAAVLEPCSGSTTQTWSVGSSIVSAVGNGLSYCLNVAETPAGYVLDVAPCAATVLQSFWPWGFPLTFANAAGSECLNNVAEGATMDDAVCRPTPGAPPRSEVFVLTENNEIVASDGFTASDGTGGTASSSCVNLDGLGLNEQSPYYSSLSTWSCGVAYANPAVTSQSWYFEPAGEHSGQWSWTTIRSQVTGAPASECIDVLGANPNPNTSVDVYECNGTLAQAWQLGVVLTDEIGFSGY